MKSIFKKTEFPVAPSGNLYDWQEAKTEFELHEDGINIIQVTASAQNDKQGREYAAKYPDKSPEELFELALAEGNIIRNLKEITEERRETILNTVSQFL